MAADSNETSNLSDLQIAFMALREGQRDLVLANNGNTFFHRFLSRIGKRHPTEKVWLRTHDAVGEEKSTGSRLDYDNRKTFTLPSIYILAVLEPLQLVIKDIENCQHGFVVPNDNEVILYLNNISTTFKNRDQNIFGTVVDMPENFRHLMLRHDGVMQTAEKIVRDYERHQKENKTSSPTLTSSAQQ